MARQLTPAQEAERSLITTYRKDIWNKFVMGLKNYQMISDGDKIAVCISGGKDSMLMAKLIQHLQKYSDKKFEAEYIVMDPGYNAENRKKIEDNAALLGIPIKIFEVNIFNYVAGLDKNPCYMCARMRRGHLYSYAQSLGCNKIALGHHFDDVIETILMGMIYGGQIQTMMPKLHSKNYEGMELIRPMYMVKEADILRWVAHNDLHFIRCACRFTESYENLENKGEVSKRQEVKQLIAQFRKTNPFIETNIFKSVYNVNLRTVIEYQYKGKRYNFLDTYDDYKPEPAEDGEEAGDEIFE
jgi:tRNA 2-thiocytidine biosynthesis protein TtcA